MKCLDNIKDFFKTRCRIAEVDGITFYTADGLERYLNRKKQEEDRKGNKMFSLRIPYYLDEKLAQATYMLESKGVFDYEVERSDDFFVVKYWADGVLLKISTKPLS